MSIVLANQVKHLSEQVQYLTGEVERLNLEVISLKAGKKVAALEMEIPSIQEIPDPGEQQGRKRWTS